MHENYKEEKTEIELKPCPFCGGEAKLFSCFKDYVDTMTYFGRCKVCGARGPQTYEFNQENKDKKAVELWNERNKPEQGDSDNRSGTDEIEIVKSGQTTVAAIFHYRHCRLVQNIASGNYSFDVYGEGKERLLSYVRYDHQLTEKEAEDIIDKYLSLSKP